MSGAQSALAIVGALVTLAVIGGGLWSVAQNASLTATKDRQSKEIAEYIARIDYIEPRWKAANDQNALLMELHNPTAQLERIEDTGKRTFELLEQQHAQLDEVAQELHRRSPRDGN